MRDVLPTPSFPTRQTFNFARSGATARRCASALLMAKGTCSVSWRRAKMILTPENESRGLRPQDLAEALVDPLEVLHRPVPVPEHLRVLLLEVLQGVVDDVPGRVPVPVDEEGADRVRPAEETPRVGPVRHLVERPVLRGPRVADERMAGRQHPRQDVPV